MNQETSKIHISSQTPIKDNFNLEKEEVNLAKVQKQTQDQIKISIIDLKLIQTISVKTKDKFLLREIFNLIRIIKNMKERTKKIRRNLKTKSGKKMSRKHLRLISSFINNYKDFSI